MKHGTLNPLGHEQLEQLTAELLADGGPLAARAAHVIGRLRSKLDAREAALAGALTAIGKGVEVHQDPDPARGKSYILQVLDPDLSVQQRQAMQDGAAVELDPSQVARLLGRAVQS